MDLPGRIDELIRRVAVANRNVAIVIQSGTPVTMPWADDTPAILQAWYGGNEAGQAIADVLFGDVNPSGKTPLSFPRHIEDNPALLNLKPEACRVLYGEDTHIGYRFYERAWRSTLFPFGHGLSYSRFVIQDLQIREVPGPEETLIVTVNV